jgi:hypothetical protein
MLPGNVSNTFTPLNVSNKCIIAISGTFPAIIARIIARFQWLGNFSYGLTKGKELGKVRIVVGKDNDQRGINKKTEGLRMGRSGVQAPPATQSPTQSATH